MMNQDSLQFALNAVSNIVHNSINRKNYKQQLSELQKFVNKFGFECERHLYRCIFDSLLATQHTDTLKNSILCQLFSDLGSFFEKPNFSTLIRFSFNKGPFKNKISDSSNTESNTADCSSVGNSLNGASNNNRSQESSGAAGVTQNNSSDLSVVNKVRELCKCLKLNDTHKLALLLCLDELDSAEREVQLSKCDFISIPELTYFMLSQLHSSKEPFAKESIEKIKEDLEASGNHISKDKFLPIDSPFCDSVEMESNSFGNLSGLSDDQITNMLVNENDVQLSSELMSQFDITPKLCAKILLALCEHPKGQDNNLPQRFEEIDTLANLCREFLPSASPLMDILQEIDSETFVNISSKMINNKHFGKIHPVFSRFWQFCSNLCNTEKQGISLLGMIFFGRLWSNNLEFQLGVIMNCVRNQLVVKLLSAGPTGPGPGGGNDLSQLVPNLESLKCLPDFEGNPELSNWKYQKLYSIIIEISAANSSNKQSVTMGSMFYNQIIDLFKWPIHHCPDLVALGLLGCGSVSSICKNDILNMTIPSFLSNHPNAAIILHTIWSTNDLIGNVQNNCQWAKQVLLQSMCEFYMKSPPEEQQQRLSRILDVAQDLKALSLLLNSNCHPFVIDLACLASRREYLKLDKWLMDKIESHGEPFVKACIVFLNRRCNALVSGNKTLDVNSLNSALPSETLATILACLQQFICNSASSVTPTSLSQQFPVSPELSETILTMVANSSYLLSKTPRSAPPGVISNNVKTPILPTVTSLSDLNDRIGSLTLTGSANSFSQSRQPFITPSSQSSITPIASTTSIMTPQMQPPVGPKSQKSGQPQASLQPHQQASQQQQSQRGYVFNVNAIFPETQMVVNPEIEKEADTYFQRIYNQSTTGSMSIDDVLEMLRRFQDSPNKRERDIFNCMIKNLFKEYCYFPQYPDKELLITAQLFGGIIQMGLVKYMALVVALRCVLEALRQPYSSKMYFFGIAALDRFKSKLKEYPLYCQHLTSIPHFNEFPRPLQEYIQYGASSEDPPSARSLPDVVANPAVSAHSPAPGQLNSALPGLIGSYIGNNINSESNRPVMMMSGMLNNSNNISNIGSQGITGPIGGQLSQVPSKIFSTSMSSQALINKPITSTPVITTSSTTRSGPSIANATNIDTLLAAGETIHSIPPESMQDKVGFIINNLSQMNLAQKTEEFKELIGTDDTYHGWIAQYFVQRRASIENNFHTLYANFLELLKLPELTKLVIRETYRNIKVLLRSDKVIANMGDRTLLKNLGHWLGMLTLAKNKPILSIDLNLKFLLIEAYHKGTQELLYVVPFIAKVLESCAKSTVFKPPSPWTMGILKALVELHQEREVKLNLRFEVEVLCRTLNVDINELVGKTTILQEEDIMNKVMMEQQLGTAGGRQHQSHISSIGLNQANDTLSNSVQNQMHIAQSQSSQGSVSVQQSISSQPPISHSSQIIKPPLTQPQSHLPNRLSMSMLSQPLVVGQQSATHSLLQPNSSPTVQIGPIHMPPTASIPMTPTSSVSPAVQQFNYHDISTNISAIGPHIVTRNDLPLIQLNPNLKIFIKLSVERSIQEWVGPVVERSNKISLTTAEQIIKKDFALESDENKMCLAAQYLIRNLTAGMAMITSKDALYGTMVTHLVQAFTRQLGPNSGVTKEMIEESANAIASSNINLACCFIQKTAIEKAIPELDKRLQHEYDIRRKARLEGRRYCDASSLTYQAERMPEAIRLKVGSVTPLQFQVYEDIGKNIPGFISPIVDHSNMGIASSMNNSLPNIGGSIGSTGPSLTNSIGMDQPFLKSLTSNVLPTVAAMSNSISANINVQPPLFSQQLSGFGPENSSNSIDTGLQTLYDKLVNELDSLFQQFVASMQPSMLITTMHSILEMVSASRNNPSNIGSAVNLIQRILEALAELIISVESGVVEVLLLTRARDLYLVILKALSDPRAYGAQFTTKQITRQVLDRLLSSSTPPLPDDLFDILMRSELINISYVDATLAQQIDGANPIALAFALQFVKLYGMDLSETQIPNIIAALLKISKSSGPTNPLNLEIQTSLDVFRTSNAPSALNPSDGSNFLMSSAMSVASREVESDSELLEKTERLMRDWINLYHSNTPPNKVFHIYVQSMNQHGILKTDDSITRFFRLSTELCVDNCYRILNGQHANNASVLEARTKCFQTLDAFAHLIVMLVKHSGSNTGSMSESTPKINLLNKVLGIIGGVAIHDQEIRNEEFQHLPYYRILIILLMELTLGPNNLGLPAMNNFQHQLGFGINPSQVDPLYESIQYQVLNAFCQTLKLLKPSKAPSFAFAWLDFIGHRIFMEKCLNGPNSTPSIISTKGWIFYAPLLIEIIKFLAPFLRNVELPHSIDLLYKGTLKVLLILLHDFPEFLCEYCYELCDAIPPNAIQMRNLVLSAFPRNMRLPDPFTPNLKIDSLPEIIQSPKGASNTLSALATVPFRKELDSYLRTRSPVTFLCELRGYLQNPNGSDGNRYNIPLINALVLFVGQSAIQAITPKHISMSSIAHSSHMDIFQNLAVDLDTEGRYLFLNAIANQLRYPNSHTHYFSCTLLYIFAESNTEAIQEQITRVLLERLIVNRPHPWGLLVTFIELIKNQSFKFWNHEFVRCAPEIEKLFESVARSCMQQQQKNQGTGNSGQISAELVRSQSS
ncbi:CCR4-NOT transcription complex subunit 1 [Tetranychus urticae]|uniref:CCR4-NOT transcription complex subunit 1 n=1 Tax=Tetranychus urticae TaxID=32264 RepID=T1KFW3_TETUR|nr:CCR4-NOT transcription complex subunit 1 [Tetranychus urticae]